MQRAAPCRKVALDFRSPAHARLVPATMATRTATLRHARDIRSVFAAGSTAHGRLMVLHAHQRGNGGPARWTVVAGRRVGGAVRRNRAKRRLRAVAASSSLPGGFDLVIVARPAVVWSPFAGLREEFEGLLGRARAQGAPAQRWDG